MMNVIVTGASQGIGLAVAEQFAATGANLCLCSRTISRHHIRHQELSEKYGIKILAIDADLSIQSSVLDFAGKVMDELGHVDVLINNAGNFLPGSIYNEPEGTLSEMLNTNLMSAYHLTRAILPSMIQRRQGHIFNICSIASLAAYANGGAYSISKAALLSFSRNLREEMKSFNIKVTSVLPGAVYTASWEGAGITPQRLMETGDIATLILAASRLSPQACVEEILVRPQLGDL